VQVADDALPIAPLGVALQVHSLRQFQRHDPGVSTLYGEVTDEAEVAGHLVDEFRPGDGAVTRHDRPRFQWPQERLEDVDRAEHGARQLHVVN
jgi:hypothetical protein